MNWLKKIWMKIKGTESQTLELTDHEMNAWYERERRIASRTNSPFIKEFKPDYEWGGAFEDVIGKPQRETLWKGAPDHCNCGDPDCGKEE